MISDGVINDGVINDGVIKCRCHNLDDVIIQNSTKSLPQSGNKIGEVFWPCAHLNQRVADGSVKGHLFSSVNIIITEWLNIRTMEATITWERLR